MMVSSANASSNGADSTPPAAGWVLAAFVAALVAVAAPGYAQSNVRIGGFLRLDRRITLSDSVAVANFYNIFRPELSANVGGADVVVSLDTRFYDLTGISATDEMGDATRHFPTTITVWEAFARIPGFLLDPLDVTVGRQRIHWGTADGFNPTDRFNPYDLSDITDLTARTPVWAIRMEYYLTDAWWVEGVWTPSAHAPLLPTGSAALLGAGPVAGLAEPVLSWKRHYAPPSTRLGNGQYGARLAGRLGGLDVSLSYFDGADGIPVADRLLVVDDPGGSDGAIGHAWTRLPGLRTLGADLATEWRGLGLWAEGAVAFPERVELTADLITGDDSLEQRSVVLSGNAYATWTAGGDYTFPGGWYLNVQWVHGLFLEQDGGELHDYLVGKVDRRFLRETVAVSFEAALELAEWSDGAGEVGYGLLPDVTYSPVDNIDVSAGAFVVGGRGGAWFARWGDADQLYLRVRAAF